MSETILELNELTSCKVICYNSFSCKDALKSRGYQYNAGQKAWWRKVDISVLEKEINELIKFGMTDSNIKVEGATKPRISMSVASSKEHSEKQATEGKTYYILQYDYNTKYTVCTSDHSEWLKKIRSNYAYLKVTPFKTLNELYLRAKMLENGEAETTKEGPLKVECTTPEQLEIFIYGEVQ